MDMHRPRWIARWIAVATGVLVWPLSVVASDYSNSCKSTDGRYEADDEVVYRASDKNRAKRLTYSVIEEQILSEHRSDCFPSNAEANGQKFGNLSRKTRLLVAIDDDGRKRAATLMCELATSGLPAAFNCDREVVTLDQKTPGPVRSYRVGSPGTWDHNGSVMKLEADGSRRLITYMNPRDGMRAAGVSGQTLLFEGERSGNSYRGTARYFSSKCGAQEFAVSGTVSADESRIELTGDSPRLDANCKPAGTKPERLVFQRNK